ncbi:uncharacterized protein Z518_06024 [Rhinocladiella mackenziei CBS 650.93]|uniref:Rhinocladiella mackenziei CBS 650.93 unplaced genomic scaffold supercont1.4, whole genome shotgun sequence n=1 Tax=Rhinocladiella mackenziei CBS 650.93 TaxID=1442369 RepID=A0A0D2FSP9_9EURO|nr:uncharacterized protein Z518_06024 [Rhinocladiella mackenziei CBS 650.93]KIX05152.1 hypothetical protein Z518_06024 [Rhinocladiella mackenziei CBS 650.93]
MAANHDALKVTFDNLVSSLTLAQIASLSDTLAVLASAKAPQPLNASIGTMQAGNTNSSQARKPIAASSRAGRRFKSVREAKVKKRCLNSWMAFRTYYSPIFKGIPQSLKSGRLKEMWAAENKKAMWVMLSQVYSDMRDRFEQIITVEKFLKTAVPFLPIIKPDEYLSKMGWILEKDAEGELKLSRSANFNAELLDVEFPPRSNISKEELIDHCIREGLGEGHARQNPMESSGDQMCEDGLMDPEAAQQTPPAHLPAHPPAKSPPLESLALIVTPQAVSQPQ